MTVASNLARSEPMETRHLDLSRNINFEENETQKGLQTATQRSDQKPIKRQNSLMRWQKWEAMRWCTCNDPRKSASHICAIPQKD